RVERRSPNAFGGAGLRSGELALPIVIDGQPVTLNGLNCSIIPILKMGVEVVVSSDDLTRISRGVRGGERSSGVNPVRSHHFIDIACLAVLRVQNVQREIGDAQRIEPIGELTD